jgi:hypothetical protein
MSEPRSLEVIQQEYGRLCNQAGHAQYQIEVLKNDLSLINEQLKSLNLEAAAAVAKAKEAEAGEKKSNE